MQAGIQRRGWVGNFNLQKALFVLSGLILVMGLLGMFTIYPLLRSLDISLRDWRLVEDEHPFNNLDNYSWALEDDVFWISMKNTAVFTVAHMSLSVVFALILAELIFPLRQPWKGMFTAVIFLPVMTSLVAVSLIFRDLFSVATGPLNYMLSFIGLGPYNFLTDGKTAMLSIIGVTTWKNLGIYTVIIMAGLSTIPGELLEAASLDGASDLQSFLRVKLPLLVPTLIYVIVTGTITSLQVFAQIFVITGGGPGTATKTLVIHLYEQGFEFFNMGRASAVAFILFAIILVITVIYLWVMKEEFEY